MIAAVGGGTVTALFDQNQSDSFGWYSIGLLAGMACYFTLSLTLRGKENWAGVMGEAVLPTSNTPVPQDSEQRPDSIRPRR